MQEYSPEQQEIRSNCFRWRRHTLSLIKNEDWDLIERNPCNPDICTLCRNNVMGESPLKPLLSVSDSDKMPYVQKVIERIYGVKTPSQWVKIIVENIPHFRKIKYFIENNLIDINDGSYETIFSIYANWSSYRDWKEQLNYFLSQGYNINIQNSYGENSLLSFLKNNYDDDYNEDDEITLKYNEKILYFLDNGSDPLLQDKEGLCALDYVKNLTVISEYRKQELIYLIERFS